MTMIRKEAKGDYQIGIYAVAPLERMGWQFMPTGPDAWTWLKFDGDQVIATQGDSTWTDDVIRSSG